VSLDAQTCPRLDKAKDCRTSEVNVHAIPLLHAISAGATGAIITYIKVFYCTLTRPSLRAACMQSRELNPLRVDKYRSTRLPQICGPLFLRYRHKVMLTTHPSTSPSMGPTIRSTAGRRPPFVFLSTEGKWHKWTTTPHIMSTILKSC
jgi:hypothetical protein